jgi:hypothetical protein
MAQINEKLSPSMVLAHAEILISCESDLCFVIIENSKCDRFQDENAALAWLNLIAKMNVIKL